MFRKNFIMGLVILLPLVITLLIIHFILDLLTSPFIDFVRPVLMQLHFDRDILFFSSQQVVTAISQVFILISLALFILVLGFFTRWYASKLLLRLADFIMLHIPIISTLYKTSQDLVKMLLGAQASAFQQVVLVPFPREGVYSIGFITTDTPHPCSNVLHTELVSVLVPTTPNPTSGFLMLFKKEQLIPTQMPVKDALKFILSCGVIHGDGSWTKHEQNYTQNQIVP